MITTDPHRLLSDAEEQGVLARSAEMGEVRSAYSGAASIAWAAIAPEAAESNRCSVAVAAVANELSAAHASSVDDAFRLWGATLELLA